MAGTNNGDFADFDLSDSFDEEELGPIQGAVQQLGLEQKPLPSEKEVLAKYVRGGVVRAGRTPGEIKEYLRKEAAIRHIDKTKEDLDARSRALNLARVKLEEDQKLLKEYENACFSNEASVKQLKEQYAANASFSNRAALGLADKKYTTALLRFNQQKKALKRSLEAYYLADRQKDILQSELASSKAIEFKLKNEKKIREHEETILAKYTNDTTLKKEAAREIALRDEVQRKEAEKAEKIRNVRAKEKVGRELASKTRTRLIDALEVARESRKEVEDYEESLRKKRIQAKEGLKQSTEAAQLLLSAENEARNNFLERRAAKRERERLELLAAGQNPLAIFAARDERRRQRNRAVKLKKALAVRETDVLQRLLREEEKNLEKAAVQRHHQDILDKFTREMGGSILEKKKKEMRESGELKPSPPKGFKSLSNTMDRTVVMSGRRGLGTAGSARFASIGSTIMNSSLDADDFKDATQMDSSIPPLPLDGTRPGSSSMSRDIHTPGDVNLDMEDSESEEDIQKTPRRIPIALNETRLKLAKQKVAAALARQKELLAKGQPKAVCGKEYKTSKFLSQPEQIIFKDFVVGRTYTQKIELTNVSFCFNTFKLVAICDEFVDYFDIKYVPVGRMSAGSVAPIYIKFRPKLLEDIHTELPLMAETGPFSVPLICLTKKADISFKTQDIDIGTVVMGDSGKKYIEIINNGALPRDFTVEFVDSTAEYEEEEFATIEHAEEDETGEKDSMYNNTKTYQGVDIPRLSLPGATAESNSKPTQKSVLFTAATAGDPGDFEDPKQSDVQEQQVVGINDGEIVEGDSEEEGKRNSFFVHTTGHVKGYSSIRFPVTFTPSKPGAFTVKLKFTFGSEKERSVPVEWASENTFTVDIKAVGCKVPIYVDKDVLDFQACLHGKLYRKVCRLHNRGKSAMKAIFSVPKPLQGFVFFTPSVGYVQKDGTFDVQVRFAPKPETQQRVSKYFPVQNNVIEVPVRVTVPNQTLPVIWKLKALLASPHITFSTSKVEFGRCFLNERVIVPITITNHSPLLQKLSFFKLPKEVQVSPNEGFFNLFPKRSLTINIIFVPRAAVDLAVDLTMLSHLGHRYQIACRGKGVEPTIQFASSLLQFAPVPDGDIGYAHTFVENLSKVEQTMEIVIPESNEENLHTPEQNPIPPRTEKSFLSVVPKVIQLQPGQRKRVELVFSPNVREVNAALAGPFLTKEAKVEEDKEESDEKKTGKIEAKKSAKKKTEAELKAEEEAAAQAEEKAKEQDSARQQQEYYSGLVEKERIQREKEAAIQRAHPANDAAKSILVRYSQPSSVFPNQSDTPWSRHSLRRIPCYISSVNAANKESTVAYLEVATTTTTPSLVASPALLDFGQVTPNNTIVKSIELRNAGKERLDLSLQSLGLNSVFTVLNELRSLEPGQSRLCVVEFRPKQERVFNQSLTICTLKSKVTIPLLGVSVKPSISVSPDGLVDMGDVVEGFQCSKTITITNSSTFDYTYNILESSIGGELNLRGLTAFHFIPGQANIPSGESKDVTVIFSPDHASTNYKTRITIAECVLTFQGRGHGRQSFVWGGDTQPALDSHEQPATSIPTISAVKEPVVVGQNPIAFLSSNQTVCGWSLASLTDAISDVMEIDKGKKAPPAKAAAETGEEVADQTLELLFDRNLHEKPEGEPEPAKSKSGRNQDTDGNVILRRVLMVGTAATSADTKTAPGAYDCKFLDASNVFFSLDSCYFFFLSCSPIHVQLFECG